MERFKDVSEAQVTKAIVEEFLKEFSDYIKSDVIVNGDLKEKSLKHILLTRNLEEVS